MTMSLIYRISEPVRVPIRRVTDHYSSFFEDLIHAVKSEIVGKLDHLILRLDNSERSTTAAFEALSDQLAIQATTIRELSDEIKQLQQTTEAARPQARPSSGQGLSNVVDLAGPEQSANADSGTRKRGRQADDAASRSTS